MDCIAEALTLSFVPVCACARIFPLFTIWKDFLVVFDPNFGFIRYDFEFSRGEFSDGRGLITNTCELG